MKNKAKALLLESIHKKAEDIFLNAGFQVERFPQTLSGEELIQKLKGISLLCSRSQTEIQSHILRSDSLLAVGAFCIGVNQIDLKIACEKGVPVFNAPYSNTRSVAELTIGLVIALSRKLLQLSGKAHQGEWDKTAVNSHEVRGKTLGIVGYGHIGSQVSVLAEALGLKVIYYDIASKLPLGNACPVSTLPELLKLSDFVTLHVPQTDGTTGMMDKDQLDLMKKGSFLINTSRGKVVNIEVLKEALLSGHLRGAALDVFPEEPKNKNQTFRSPLQNLKNVILTPHIGGSTKEAQESIAKEVSKSLLEFFFEGRSVGAVNFPHLNPPALESSVRRILNIHENQPGVLGQINQLISESQANIKAQYLSTNEFVGYLIIDVEKENVEDLCLGISRLKPSIKTRVISSRL